MKLQRHWIRVVFAATGLVLVVTAWIFFAPTQFGGQVSYVIVNGNSMEPVFHRDDLVLVRAATDYRIGDIVTYRNPQIGPVIHRIVDQQNDRFFMKGDNNYWLDAYLPSQDEMIGKYWLYLPSAGRVVKELRTPWNMAILVAILGVIGMSAITANPARRPWRQDGRGRSYEPGFQFNTLNEFREGLLFILATLGVVSFLLAIFAFTSPVTRSVSDDLPYTQSGEFSYSATAPTGVYDSKSASAGEPLFRKLTNAFDVQFAYRLSGDQLSDVNGSYQLVAEVSDTNGWKRTLYLKADTLFDGNQFTTHGVVDLKQVQTLIDSFEQQTGVHESQYTLSLVPQVSVQGTLAGQDLTGRFSPRLTFRIDSLQVQLVKDDPNAQPLQVTQKGLLKLPVVKPNTLSLFSLNLNVLTARWIALIGLGIALFGITGIGLAVTWTSRDEAAQMDIKYGSMLVAIQDNNLQVTDRVIKVTSMDELAKLADKDGRMILHQTYGKAHNYFVQDSAITYVYQIRPDEASRGLELAQVQTAPSYDSIIEGWSRFLFLRDKNTDGHSQRAIDLTLRIGRQLGLSEEELNHLRRGVMLHDIGKIGIPDAILLKPGPLTDDERAIMQKHPEYAYEALAPIHDLHQALEVPYCHHERWDGKGYPRGLKGEQIPLTARIFAVVDVWDSLCSNRPYRNAWTGEQALAYICQESGKQFDPMVVDTFLGILDTTATPFPVAPNPEPVVIGN